MEYYTINLYGYKSKKPKIKIAILSRTETTANNIRDIMQRVTGVEIKRNKRKPKLFYTTTPPYLVEQEQKDLATNTDKGLIKYLIEEKERYERKHYKNNA